MATGRYGSKFSWRALGLSLLACTLAFMGGVGVAFAVFLIEPPESLQTPKQPTKYPVSVRNFTDPQSVEVVVTLGDETTISTPVSGIVTAVSNREEGESISSGEPIAQVDGEAVIALATTFPLWRDLPLGATGKDVEALQLELRRLGKQVPISGTVDRETLSEAADVLRLPEPLISQLETIPANKWVWIASPEVQIKRMELAIGQRISVGEDMITLVATPATAHVRSLPSTLPGDRSIAIGDERYAVDRDGDLEQSLVDDLMLTPQFTAASQAAGNVDRIVIAASWELVRAVPVYAVPPSAIFDMGAEDRCVYVNGEPVAVELVSSELGMSLVASNTVLTAIDVAPQEGSTCQ